MTAFLGSVAVLAAFLVSTYGWGRLAGTYFYREAPRSPAFHVTLGLALWIFLGGLLNSGRLAFPIALYAMFVLGLCLAVWSAYLAMSAAGGVRPVWASLCQVAARPGFKLGFAEESLPVLIVVAAAAFLIATQLPTTLFNYHDDFHKYLVRPFRMLQTGSLAGGPFDLVGLDSVGSQSFLQSFILVRFPIQYVNAFDPVFALLVSGLLINDIGRRAGIHWLFRAISTLVLVVVNPQYVNISALFSGDAMILGLIYAGFLLAESRDAPDMATPIKAAIPFGLMTASLIGLKVTFLPYAALYFAIYFLAFVFLARNRLRAAGIGAVTAVTTFVAFGPWMALSSNNYASLIYRRIIKLFVGAEKDIEITITPDGFESLFSTTELYYGGSYYDYNFIAFTIAAAGLLCAVRLVRSRKSENRDLDPMAAFAACGAATISYFVSAYLISPALAIRYTCPLLIAVLPAAMLVLGRTQVVAGPATGRGAAQASSLATVLVVCQALAIGLFADVAVNRGNLALKYRAMLSFRFSAEYMDYTRAALDQADRERARKGQSATEEGEVIYAWIAQPYHLDFARNEILTTPNPDWSIRYRGIGFDLGPEEFRRRLASYGVRYVMWEYKSYGMRSDESLRKDMKSSVRGDRDRGRNTLSLKKMLVALANASKVIYNDGRTVVADIRK